MPPVLFIILYCVITKTATYSHQPVLLLVWGQCVSGDCFIYYNYNIQQWSRTHGSRGLQPPGLAVKYQLPPTNFVWGDRYFNPNSLSGTVQFKASLCCRHFNHPFLCIVHSQKQVIGYYLKLSLDFVASNSFGGVP